MTRPPPEELVDCAEDFLRRRGEVTEADLSATYGYPADQVHCHGAEAIRLARARIEVK